MSTVRPKVLAILVAISTALGVAHAWRPSRYMADTLPPVDLSAIFPPSFADWSVDAGQPIQLVSPDTQAVLDKIYNQTLARTYISGAGERVMLSVAYGGDQSDATRAHRPEACYPAQGFEIVTSHASVLALKNHNQRVRQLVARKDDRTEVISYWITIGDRVATSGAEHKLAQLSYSTRGIVPDGILVRISNISNDTEAAYQLHKRFLEELLPALTPAMRQRIGGM